MEKHEAEKIIDTIRSLVEDAPPDELVGGRRAGKTKLHGKPLDDDGAIAFTSGSNGRGEVPAMFAAGAAAAGQAFDEEAMYQRFRARFIDDAQADPVLLKLIMVQPELIVGYERKAESIDTTSLRGRIAKLIALGFLKTDRTTQAIRSELMRTGGEPNSGRLGQELAALRAAGFLTREGDHWQVAPGVKVTETEIAHKG